MKVEKILVLDDGKTVSGSDAYKVPLAKNEAWQVVGKKTIHTKLEGVKEVAIRAYTGFPVITNSNYLAESWGPYQKVLIVWADEPNEAGAATVSPQEPQADEYPKCIGGIIFATASQTYNPDKYQSVGYNLINGKAGIYLMGPFPTVEGIWQESDFIACTEDQAANILLAWAEWRADK